MTYEKKTCKGFYLLNNFFLQVDLLKITIIVSLSYFRSC